MTVHFADTVFLVGLKYQRVKYLSRCERLLPQPYNSHRFDVIIIYPQSTPNRVAAFEDSYHQRLSIARQSAHRHNELGHYLAQRQSTDSRPRSGVGESGVQARPEIVYLLLVV